MAVVINEFEVVPAPAATGRQARRGRPTPRRQTGSDAALTSMRVIERATRAAQRVRAH